MLNNLFQQTIAPKDIPADCSENVEQMLYPLGMDFRGYF